MLASSRVPSPTKPHRAVADSAPSSFPHEEERIGFFMVRLFAGARASGGALSGEVEWMGIGDKREFRGPEELARIIDEWSR
jgi:hypothetical protein